MDRCPKIEYGRLFGEIGWLGVDRGIVSAKRGQAVQLKERRAARCDRRHLRGLAASRASRALSRLAAELRPHLAGIDGFVSVERFGA